MVTELMLDIHSKEICLNLMLVEFIQSYNPENRNKRKTTRADNTPEGRWRKFTYDEIISPDKCSLDISWLKDDSLIDLESLPDPQELAKEIIENLKVATENFSNLLKKLSRKVELK